jgi:hypothetical protein
MVYVFITAIIPYCIEKASTLPICSPTMQSLQNVPRPNFSAYFKKKTACLSRDKRFLVTPSGVAGV